MNTNTLPVLFLIVLYSSPSPAQERQEWVTRYHGEGNGWDAPYAMTVDPGDNVYVTGRSRGVSTYDFATVKYDGAGNQIWVARYDNFGRGTYIPVGIALDPSGNVYVAGDCPAVDLFQEYCVIKYSADGEEVWVARYGTPGNNSWATAMAVDGSGNVYVTGESPVGIQSFTDFATVKYDSNGNQVWVALYDPPGNGNAPFAIAVDGQENIYVTGAAYFGFFRGELATIKYAPDGRQLWVTRYAGPFNGMDTGRAIAVDSSGNVFVTGQSCDPYDGIYLCPRADYATIKYSPDGSQTWVNRYGDPGGTDDSATAMALDCAGDVYVTGATSAGRGMPHDYATIKYNTAGEQLWVARYRGSFNGDTRPLALARDSAGSVYVTGSGQHVSDHTFWDYATLKYDSDGNEIWTATYNFTGDGQNGSVGVAIDPSGNVYVTGYSERTRTSWDFATIKYTQGQPQVTDKAIGW